MIAEAVAERRSRLSRPTAPEDYEYCQAVSGQVRAALRHAEEGHRQRSESKPPPEPFDPLFLVAAGLALLLLALMSALS